MGGGGGGWENLMNNSGKPCWRLDLQGVDCPNINIHAFITGNHNILLRNQAELGGTTNNAMLHYYM